MIRSIRPLNNHTINGHVSRRKDHCRQRQYSPLLEQFGPENGYWNEQRRCPGNHPIRLSYSEWAPIHKKTIVYLSEWDAAAGRSRWIKNRDKLVNYPRLVLGLEHPPPSGE
jgi:hypothetical protein